MNRESKAGFSIVSAAVTMALISIAAFIFATSSKSLFQIFGTSDTRSDLVALQKKILQNLDCELSLGASAFPPPDCTVSTPTTIVTLRNSAGNLLTASPITTWSVRAFCGDSKLVLERRSNSATDPVTNLPSTWQPLFAIQPPLCNNYVSASGQVPVIRKDVFMTNSGLTCLRGGTPSGSGANPGHVWTGTAPCDPGYSAIGGGANCNVTRSNLIASISDPPPPNTNPTGWHVRCCILDPAASVSPIPKTFVNCLRQLE